MLTPGELNRGMWIMIHSGSNKNDNAGWYDSQPEQPQTGTIMGLFSQSAHKLVTDCPFLVLVVELPYLVVADTMTNPYGTYIWDTREYNLMEVSPEFVRAYTPQGFDRGQTIIRTETQQPAK